MRHRRTCPYPARKTALAGTGRNNTQDQTDSDEQAVDNGHGDVLAEVFACGEVVETRCLTLRGLQCSAVNANGCDPCQDTKHDRGKQRSCDTGTKGGNAWSVSDNCLPIDDDGVVATSAGQRVENSLLDQAPNETDGEHYGR